MNAANSSYRALIYMPSQLGCVFRLTCAFMHLADAFIQSHLQKKGDMCLVWESVRNDSQFMFSDLIQIISIATPASC